VKGNAHLGSTGDEQSDVGERKNEKRGSGMALKRHYILSLRVV
jgi:hypothetical protein